MYIKINATNNDALRESNIARKSCILHCHDSLSDVEGKGRGPMARRDGLRWVQAPVSFQASNTFQVASCISRCLTMGGPCWARCARCPYLKIFNQFTGNYIHQNQKMKLMLPSTPGFMCVWVCCSCAWEGKGWLCSVMLCYVINQKLFIQDEYINFLSPLTNIARSLSS